ncbi:hypothetical protein [Streptomyces sp. NBC_01092]|uniref:hypothetical protein n=1 Tax=Streptomyces sp. NBC_01092 TaxID=2903748 RepID=UPI003864685B|nr:hypothetical protein OG254_15770 [Streptomyces sp. NBC_01092]
MSTRTAVLYVCVDRGRPASKLPTERAIEEGLVFADERDLRRLVGTITDPYGEPDPRHREGWQRVCRMAARGEITDVITRWPAALAPESHHELRFRETEALAEHGVTIRYSWEPLAALKAAP